MASICQRGGALLDAASSQLESGLSSSLNGSTDAAFSFSSSLIRSCIYTSIYLNDFFISSSLTLSIIFLIFVRALTSEFSLFMNRFSSVSYIDFVNNISCGVSAINSSILSVSSS